MNLPIQPSSDAVAEHVEAMIVQLRDLGALTTREVENALRAVPRWRFTGSASLETAYDPQRAVVTKQDRYGVDISSVSAPEVQAIMAEQADIRPGHRVLELGSGGYFASVLRNLVGPSGHVTTVDIDPDVTGRARELLNANGYADIDVVTTDATKSLPPGPWNRIVVTVGAWDIPPLWIEHLHDDGRLVVPLRMKGITRSLALEPVGDALKAVSARQCGFVPMQGSGAHEERMFLLHGEDAALRFDDNNVPDLTGVTTPIATLRYSAWTGVETGAGEDFGSLTLYLAAALEHFCRLKVASGVDRVSIGLVKQGENLFPQSCVHGSAVAYLISRHSGEGRFEFGVAAFGPDRDQAAAEMANRIREWDRLRPHAVDPSITIWPKNITPPSPGGLVLDKHHTSIVLSWTDGTPPRKLLHRSTKEKLMTLLLAPSKTYDSYTDPIYGAPHPAATTATSLWTSSWWNPPLPSRRCTATPPTGAAQRAARAPVTA